MTSPPRPRPVPVARSRTYVARTPTDLVAMVPLVLGFHPQDSVVLLTFGGPRSFHARVDLPPALAEQQEVAATLVGAVVRNEAAAAAVLLYTDDVAAAQAQAELVVTALLEAGRPVVDVLRVEDDQWFRVPDEGAGGTAYDLRSHPFTVQRVFEGHVVHDDRAALAGTLRQGDAADRQEVMAAATAFADRLVWRARRCSEEERAELLLVEARWLQALVRRHLGNGTLLDAADAARTLVLLSQIELRDVAWSELNRANAERHIELWRDLVRRAPDDLLPAPAALLAFSAWQAGHGALAWCAVDCCLDQDPDYSLATIVGDLLAQAVPPHDWEPVPPAELPVFRGTSRRGRAHSS